MTIHYERLLGLEIPVVEQTYSDRDVMLYALGVGIGADPADASGLSFVYENKLKVLPTFAAVLAQPGLWPRDLDTGIDYIHVLHGEQRLTIHRELPVAGSVIGRTRVVDVVDKGPGRGMLLLSERTISDKMTGHLLATVGHTAFCRADGGFGGPPRSPPQPHRLPARAPDLVCSVPTTPQAALVYRLSVDRNPLHVDPAVARAAGFSRPILHGLATYGAAGYALLKSLCGNNPSRVRRMDCRFIAPAYPGETFATDIWVDGDVASFQTRAVERNVVVISNGRFDFSQI